MRTAFSGGHSEERRLATLHALRLLDSDPEREFDALVELAAQILDCPKALLTLVDRDRQWVKAKTGTDLVETRRDIAFCDHTIRSPDPLIVEDATRDLRFRASPLVTQQGVRFYAGTAIHALDDLGERQAIGALCVIGDRPRTLSDPEREALGRLATVAEVVIAARSAAARAIALAERSERQTSELARRDQVFRQAERMTEIGSWRLYVAEERLEWSEGVFRIHGVPVGRVPNLYAALDFYPPDARAVLTATLARAIESGEPFDVETDFVTAQGRRRRVRAMGEIERSVPGGEVIIGVFQDVTERHALETQLRRSADTDPLTGLANRAAFERELVAAMEAARRDGGALLLALIDLDGFKAINDTLGHVAGDDVLRAVGRVLGVPWLRGSVAARLGGDEFAMIVTDPALAAEPDRLRMRLEAELCIPVVADGVSLISAGTVGLVGYDRTIATARDMVRRADAVMYAAKRLRVGERRRA